MIPSSSPRLVARAVSVFVTLPLLTSLWIGAGCTQTVAAKDFVNADLFGRIGGKDWQYKYAYIDPTIETPEEDDLVFVFLPFVPKDECPKASEIGKDPRSVMVSAPKGRKLIKLKQGSPRSLVFHTEKKGEAQATVAKDGKIKLTVISPKAVKGKVFSKHNDGNWVSGNFSAVVCDYAAMQ